MRTFHIDGSAPPPRHVFVFVFGSNLSGIHGAGAAKAARLHYGAERGVAEGPTGNSYAIPTVSHGLKYTLPLAEIQMAVDRFLTYAAQYPDTQFFVTRIGCGLAGYEDHQIAPMFRDAPANCSLPAPWQQYV